MVKRITTALLTAWLATDLYAQGIAVRSNGGRTTNHNNYAEFSLYNTAGNSLLSKFDGSGWVGNGYGLTNVPSKWFDSIAAMTNSTPVSNLVVHVWSYFGTNWEGGGVFAWENSTATADLGLVFVGTSGRWRRVDTGFSTNVVFCEWYGAMPSSKSAAPFNDSTAAIQAAIGAVGQTGGAVFTPPYETSISSSLVFTNWRGNRFGGRNQTKASGYNYYPSPVSVIHWIGANGGTMLKVHNSGNNTFANFGLDTRAPTSTTAYWTNPAGLMMDVDMFDPHITTTTANHFDSIYFRERGTNVSLVGLRIAYTGGANSEFFRFENCYFQGSGGNIPDYWVSATNIGAAKAIQLGGGGGGANSFGHKMVNCGFNSWQYFVYSQGGSWDIENNYGTAAGIGAYYIDGVKASVIRSTEDEGDRQFVISPSVQPVILEGNRLAWAATSVSNIAQVDGVCLILDGNLWNTDASGLMPAVTNSFNSTGWYYGRNNKMPNTNDTNVASWRFLSSFKSSGDFGTIVNNNNIQSGPWKVPSTTQTTNVVYMKYTDGTASAMALTLMPSNGVFGVGSYINNVHAAFYNPDLTKTSFQFGDSVLNPRFNLITSSSGNITEARLYGNTSTFFEIYSGSGSTATRLDLTGASAVNKIHARIGSLKFTGTNDQDLLTFGLDYKTKFPADTNFEVVGQALFSRALSTNGYISLATNYLANLNTAGFTNSSIAPGIGGTNSMFARVTATSGSLEYYHRSGINGGTIAGIGIYTNTLTATPVVIPVGVNCGFIIRSPVGVDIQAFAGP